MKSYVSPIVSFESFELGTNVASSCGKPTHTPARGMCGIDMGGGEILFITGMDVCTKPVKDGEYGYCYHNPDDAHSLFNS